MTLFLLVLVDSKNVIFILPQKGAKHKEANHMDNNKKPSEHSDIKELLTNQLQLVGKESKDAHGDTLAHLSEAMACLSNALMPYIG